MAPTSVVAVRYFAVVPPRPPSPHSASECGAFLGSLGSVPAELGPTGPWTVQWPRTGGDVWRDPFFVTSYGKPRCESSCLIPNDLQRIRWFQRRMERRLTDFRTRQTGRGFSTNIKRAPASRYSAFPSKVNLGNSCDSALGHVSHVTTCFSPSPVRRFHVDLQLRAFQTRVSGQGTSARRRMGFVPSTRLFARLG